MPNPRRDAGTEAVAAAAGAAGVCAVFLVAATLSQPRAEMLRLERQSPCLPVLGLPGWRRMTSVKGNRLGHLQPGYDSKDPPSRSLVRARVLSLSTAFCVSEWITTFGSGTAAVAAELLGGNRLCRRTCQSVWHMRG